jgi:hypothetical protein
MNQMNDEYIHDYIEPEFINVLDHITYEMLPTLTRGDKALMYSAARQMVSAATNMMEREGGDTTRLLHMALKDLPVRRDKTGQVMQQMHDLNKTVTIADRDAVRTQLATMFQQLRYDDIPAITIFVTALEQSAKLMVDELGSTRIPAILLASAANEFDQQPIDRSIDDDDPRGH